MPLRSSELGRVVWVVRVSLVVALCAVSIATWASAQSDEGVKLEVVEIWIQGKVSAERQWKRDLSKSGIAFVFDAAVEDRLRRAGAGDDWLVVLRRSRYNPPRVALSAEAEAGPPVLSRRELRPLYFGAEARIAPFVGIARLEETGGAVEGRSLRTASGNVPLKSNPLAKSIMTYGMTVDLRAFGLDLEGAFQPDLFMLNIGAKYTPFLPIGQTGVRALVGVMPFLGFTRQSLGRLPQSTAGGQDAVVDLLNTTFGGDVSAGLAYHWRPGAWLFAEIHYRMTSTLNRELRAPGQASITEEIPWSKWSAKGPILRFGVGF